MPVAARRITSSKRLLKPYEGQECNKLYAVNLLAVLNEICLAQQFVEDFDLNWPQQRGVTSPDYHELGTLYLL